MSSGGRPRSDRDLLLGGVSFGVLGVAGFVIALSWAFAFPKVVLALAWLTAFVAMVAALMFAFREARASGTGVLTALGRSLKALGRFIFWFF